MHIAWKIQTTNWSIASVRYRFWLIFSGLGKGWKKSIYCGKQELFFQDMPDIMIFVKTVSRYDFNQAVQLKKSGVFVLYDLCDNLFYLPDFFKSNGDAEKLKQAEDHAEVLRGFLLLADCVTVPTVELKNALISYLPDIKRIEVLPDPVMPQIKQPFGGLRFYQYFNYLFGHGWRWGLFKSLQTLNSLFLYSLPKYLFSKIQKCLGRLAGFINSRILECLFKILNMQVMEVKTEEIASMEPTPSPSMLSRDTGESPLVNLETRKDFKKLLWFGNAGREGLFGITDLLGLQSDLEKLYEEIPFTLTVVSNDENLYKKHLKNMRFHSEYLSWSESVVENELVNADVVILPNSENSFSRCKSANRTLLALSRGKPVVASSNPSLMALEGGVLFDDWYSNVKTYLLDEELQKKHIKEAENKISSHFTYESYISSWEKILESFRLNSDERGH